MYIKNSNGPNTDPYGTPLKTSQGVEVRPPTHNTLCVPFLPGKKKSNLLYHLFHRNDSALATKDDEVLALLKSSKSNLFAFKL